MTRDMLKRFTVLLAMGMMLMVSIASLALAKEPIELSMVHFGPKNLPEIVPALKFFAERGNQKGAGMVKITVRGGPEVINLLDQPVAVQMGTVDIAYHSVTFMSSLVPGIEMFACTQLSPDELRKNGAFDYARQLFAAAGIYYLGTGGPSEKGNCYIITKNKLEKPEDFKGKRVAGSPPFFPFFKGLGMVPTPISGLKDYYPGLERGIFSAHMGTDTAFLATGSCELAKYIIDHPFWSCVGFSFIMNLKKWESLPTEVQNLLHETMEEYETLFVPYWDDLLVQQRKKLTAAGVEFYKLSPPTDKWYIDMAYDPAWELAQKRYPADLVANLKSFLRP